MRWSSRWLSFSLVAQVLNNSQLWETALTCRGVSQSSLYSRTSVCIARYRGLSCFSASLSACPSAVPGEAYTELLQLIRPRVPLWQTILLQVRSMRDMIIPSKSKKGTFVNGSICPQQGAVSHKTRSTTAPTSARTSTVASGKHLFACECLTSKLAFR